MICSAGQSVHAEFRLYLHKRWTMRNFCVLSALIFAVVSQTAAAQPSRQCFSAEDTRQRIEDDSLVPMSEITKIVRSGRSDEIISARLCETNGNLVYMIAVLERSGKVMRMIVDARSGQIITHR
jgi:uncharacterized membrane protein YkoI